VRVCPNCGRENTDDAAFCQQCGTSFASAWGGQTTSSPGQDPTAAAPAQSGDYQVSQRGQRYGVGYGPTFYGVWDLNVGGAPVAWFDRTPEGWESAWGRFQQLESGGWTGGGGLPSWRRAHVGWVLLHIVIAFAIWFGQLLVMGVVLSATGRVTQADFDSLPQETQDALGGVVVLSLATSLLGWMLFVYLRKGLGARLAAMLIPMVIGFAALLWVWLDKVPSSA